MFREFCKENIRFVRVVSLFSIISVCMCFVPTGIKAEQFQGREILEGVWEGDSVMYLDSMVLVVLHDTATQAQFDTETSTLGCATLDSIDACQFLTVDITDGTTVYAMCDSIELRSTVRYAIPNFFDTATLACEPPSDTAFYKQWNLHNTGQAPTLGTVDADIDYLEFHAIESGSPSIRIGILDSGIPIDDITGELSNPELNDTTRIILGPDYANGDDEPRDYVGHGTAVAGIIGARTNNIEGVAGIAPGCEMLIVQTHEAGNTLDGTTVEALHDAIVYAVINGCDIISASWWWHESTGEPIKDALICAKDSGVIACFVGGNAGPSNPTKFPANLSATFDNIIAVGATDLNDDAIAFQGDSTLTVAAPSAGPSSELIERIWTTKPNYEYSLGPGAQNYYWFGGTSAATPQVAALAALILSRDSSLTPSQVRNIITSTADPVNDPNNYLYGAGRINIQAALLKVIDSTNQTIQVPSAVSTIQGAICCAKNGWTVSVANGTYNEQISFEGKAITVKGSDVPFLPTKISRARFLDGEDTASVLEYIMFDGGTSAVVCVNSSPTLRRLAIINTNPGSGGGAIALRGVGWSDEGDSPARIINCTFRDISGTAIMDRSTSPPEIRNCILLDNDTGLVWATDSLFDEDHPILDYNVVYGNSIAYSASIDTTKLGDSTINADPLLGTTHTPGLGSPCIDAGDPAAIYNDPDDSRNDIGWQPCSFCGGFKTISAGFPVTPETFTLSQNYPNPFNPVTKISLTLVEKSEWKIEIYNIMGQKVESFTGVGEAGTVTVEWSAASYASGIYLYKATAGSFSQTRKMTLLK